MLEVTLHDGSTLACEIDGAGPILLLPVNPYPVDGERAEELRQYGVDPALGQSLLSGLRDTFRVVAFDYEGHCLRLPKPDTLTPANIVRDLLTIADAVGAEQFVYYGYSWLAMIGLQLAIRTDRLAGLAMGGYPPLHGPYAAMLRVTEATYNLALHLLPPGPDEDPQWSDLSLDPNQTRQFVTLYQALRDFDDEPVQVQITCPRLCFVGSADSIYYGERWGDVVVSMAEPVMQSQAQLAALGWTVRILDGLDHIQAMQAPQVVPLLLAWWTAQAHAH
jgi:pimeloyl-ACP methyl ester carboxylesterase